MTLDQIRYFIEIVNAGSINQAAKKLYVTQPTVSSTIKTLEENLNYKLFNRSSKGVELTRQGAEFLNYAEKIFENIDKINNIDAGVKNTPIDLKISAQFVSSCILPFDQLVETYKDMPYSLKMVQRSIFEVIEDVSENNYDLGILFISTNQESLMNSVLLKKELEFTPLCKLGLSVVLSKNHPLAGKKSLSHQDLKDYPLVFFDFSSKDYYGASVINEVGFNDFPQKITVNDSLYMLYTLERLNGISFITTRNKLDFNLVINKIGFDSEIIDYDTSDKFTLGYIRKKNRITSLSRREYIRNFISIIDSATS